jgi:hypothetical protein
MMKKRDFKYVFEAGKKFWQIPNGELQRCHYKDFTGPRFRHRRCPFCKRITSIHILHWLNHTEKCAPLKYSISDLSSMRYRPLSELRFHFTGKIGIGRNPQPKKLKY